MKIPLLRLILALVIVCACFSSAIAQVVIADAMGRPLQTKQYLDVQGSQYLFSDWRKGDVTLADGIIFEGLDLMYDLMNDEVIFKGDDEQAQTFLKPVVKFSLYQNDGGIKKKKNFRKGYTPVDAASPGAFYEVLTDGENVQLLKRYYKNVFEEMPYGSATKVKKFQDNASYYIAKVDKLEKIKLDKKSVLGALPGKVSELEKYIKAHRLNLRNDSDIAQLVNYYNSL
ncbi:hypothetical protein [Pontibacter litorisediminis]|uniref:hypothetical protein n=1 Tax=Pontibacter litorisediminis TaxID=1846260 RepID=UPI0023EDEF51|nr:hypothetical protein [Pontibacter litorisediminis]